MSDKIRTGTTILFYCWGSDEVLAGGFIEAPSKDNDCWIVSQNNSITYVKNFDYFEVVR